MTHFHLEGQGQDINGNAMTCKFPPKPLTVLTSKYIDVPSQSQDRNPGIVSQTVGERLGRYEVEKRCAIEKEDYDLAKQKKQQMDDYRMKVYQQLELHNLLDMGT
eukprot:g38039.t1